MSDDVHRNRVTVISEERRDAHFADLDGGWAKLHDDGKAYLKDIGREDGIIITLLVDMTPQKKKKFSKHLIAEAHCTGLAALAFYTETQLPEGFYLIITETRYGNVSMIKGVDIDIPSLQGEVVNFSNEGGRFFFVGV